MIKKLNQEHRYDDYLCASLCTAAEKAAIAPQLLMRHLISHNFIQLIYSGRIK